MCVKLEKDEAKLALISDADVHQRIRCGDGGEGKTNAPSPSRYRKPKHRNPLQW